MTCRQRNQRAEDIEWSVEDVTLIWLDEYIDDSEQSRRIQRSLSELNNYAQFYTDPYSCLNYIKKHIGEQILLIISCTFYEQFSCTIHSFDTIHSIFLFCANDSKFISLPNEYSDVVEIHTGEIQLIRSVSKSIHSIFERTLYFTLLNAQTEKSTRGSESALWFQLLLDILKKLPHTAEARDEMLKNCSDQYQSCSRALIKIEEFRTSYVSSEAIQWYTAECFLYKLLNKALRSEDIDLLHLFRFYIVDLCYQLEHEHNRQAQMNRSDDNLTTYRGQIISANELNQLQCNSNVQISMNTFMSTSKNRNAALAFIAGFEDTQQRKRVLFQIKIGPDLKAVIYADISHLSHHKDEEEVLFNLGTVFRITAVLFDEEFDVWTIQMTPIDNAFEYLEDFLKLKNNEMKNYSSTIVFGRLLIYELGQTEKAENYFQMLLNTLPNDHEDLPSVYHNLGSVYRQKGELKSALEHYLKAYHLRQEECHPNHPHIASSLRNIGLTYYAKKDYITALKYLGDTLRIEETNSPEDDENKAVTMVHLGMAYNGEKQYAMALKYLSNAYQMYQRILPEKHPDIGWAASRIGFCYEDQQNYDEALHYYNQAYERDKKILCSDHQDLTEDLNRIVGCYLKQGKYDLATTIAKESLTEQTLKLRGNHPRIGYTLLTIAQIYQSDNHFEEALDHYEQSLRMFEQCFPFDQKAILECLIAKSELFSQYGQFESALSIRVEVLSLQEKLFSSVHISAAQSLLFIGQLYKHARNYHQALEYFNKSSKIYHIHYEPDHADVKYVLNQIETTKHELSNDEIDKSQSNE